MEGSSGPDQSHGSVGRSSSTVAHKTPSSVADNSVAAWRLRLRAVLFPEEDRRAWRHLDATDYRRRNTNNDYFGAVSLAVVLLNLLTLALYDPTGTRQRSELMVSFLENADYFFVPFFALETALRIVCLGVRPVFTRAWNAMDLFIVVSSIASLILQSVFPQLSSVSGLRAIRVFRPLRAAIRVPEIRVVLNSMVKSLKYLVDVGTLYVLFVVAMSCAGVILFAGQLQRRCVRNEYFFLADSAAADVNLSLATLNLIPPGNSTNSSETTEVFFNVSHILSALAILFESSKRYRTESSQLFGPDVFNLSNSTSADAAFLGNVDAYRVDWVQLAVLDPLFVGSLLNETLADFLYRDAERPADLRSPFVCGDAIDQVLLLESQILLSNAQSRLDQLRRNSTDSAATEEEAILERLQLQLRTFTDITGNLGCDSSMTCDSTTAADPASGQAFFLGYLCPYGYSCIPVDNPKFGYFSFDNFGTAALSVLTIVTTEMFPESLYYLSGATSTFSAVLFNVFVAVIGTLFIVNLLVALISIEFEKSRAEDAVRRKAAKLLSRSAGSHAGDGKAPLNVRTLMMAQEHLDRQSSASQEDTLFGSLAHNASHTVQQTDGQVDRLEEPLLQRSHVAAVASPSHANLRRSRQNQSRGILEDLRCSLDEWVRARRMRSKLVVRYLSEQEGAQRPRLRSVKRTPPTSVAALPPSDPGPAVLVANASFRAGGGTALLPPSAASITIALHTIDPLSITTIERMRYAISSKLVHTKGFVFITSFLMILMLVNMSIPFYDMPQTMTDAIDGANLFFTVCISLEMLLRFVASEPTVFFTDAGQFIGTFVVAVSWADVGSNAFEFPVIRSLRLFVAIKLLRYFPTLYGQLMIVIESFRASLVLVFLIAVELFIFACLGMQVFGGNFKQSCQRVAASMNLSSTSASTYILECTEIPRVNFDSFLYAMLSSFSILAQDNWMDLMYRVMSTYTNRWSFGAVAVLFTSQFYFGVYVLLNLFIAILMSATDKLFQQPFQEMTPDEEALIGLSDEDEEDDDEEKENDDDADGVRKEEDAAGLVIRDREDTTDDFGLRKGDALLETGSNRVSSSSPSIKQNTVPAAGGTKGSTSSGTAEAKTSSSLVTGRKRATSTTSPASTSLGRSGRGNKFASAVNSYIRLVRREDIVRQTARASQAQRRRERIEELEAQRKKEAAAALRHDGLVAELRFAVLQVVEHPLASYLILIATLISTVAMTLKPLNLPRVSERMRILRLIDTITSGIFITEFVLRVIGKGPRQMFCRLKGWSYLDLFLTVCNIADLVLSYGYNEHTTIMHATRALYILRPLRILRQAPGIKVVIRSLVGALRPLKDVLTVSFIAYFIFAIVGLQLFMGSLRTCIEDPAIRTRDACQAAGYQWRNNGRNFDNIGEAMLSMFVISSLEGWQDILFATMDAVEPGVAPVKDANPAASLYVVSFAVIGGFFFVNFFVSVLVRSYQEEKERMQRISMFLTEVQEAWFRTQRLVLASMPLSEFLAVPPHERLYLSTWNRVRARVIQWVLSPAFQWTIDATVVLSIVASAVQHDKQDQSYTDALAAVNVFVTGVYIVEFVLKIVAVHPELYFSSSWNRFDLLILVTSIIDVALGFSETNQDSRGITRTVKLFRAARLLRLAQKHKRIASIIFQFLRSLYGLLNVSAFLALFLCVFALGVMWQFGSIEMDGTVITVYRNFSSFGSSVQLLMSLLLGGDWSVMNTCSLEEGDPGTTCSDAISSCGNRARATILFLTFFILGRYVLLNIFIAVIVEAFRGSQSGDDPRHVRTVTEADMKTFVRTWVKYDKDRRLYCRTQDLVPMLLELPSGHPFALPGKRAGDDAGGDTTQSVRARRRTFIQQQFRRLAFLASLGLEDTDGSLEFFDVLTALVRVTTKAETVDEMIIPARQQFEKQFQFRLQCRPKPSAVFFDRHATSPTKLPPQRPTTVASSSASSSSHQDFNSPPPVSGADTRKKVHREAIEYFAASFVADVWAYQRRFADSLQQAKEREKEVELKTFSLWGDAKEEPRERVLFSPRGAGAHLDAVEPDKGAGEIATTSRNGFWSQQWWWSSPSSAAAVGASTTREKVVGLDKQTSHPPSDPTKLGAEDERALLLRAGGGLRHETEPIQSVWWQQRSQVDPTPRGESTNHSSQQRSAVDGASTVSTVLSLFQRLAIARQNSAAALRRDDSQSVHRRVRVPDDEEASSLIELESLLLGGNTMPLSPRVPPEGETAHRLDSMQRQLSVTEALRFRQTQASPASTAQENRLDVNSQQRRDEDLAQDHFHHDSLVRTSQRQSPPRDAALRVATQPYSLSYSPLLPQVLSPILFSPRDNVTVNAIERTLFGDMLSFSPPRRASHHTQDTWAVGRQVDLSDY